jgi:hypothetical protein
MSSRHANSALGFGAAALAGNLECPDGAILEGSAPPRGHKQWCQLPDGTQHGPSLFWYPTGEKRVEANFVDGRLQGPVTEWHRNGQKAEQGFYKDDNRDGTFATWYKEGTKESLEEYKANVPACYYTLAMESWTGSFPIFACCWKSAASR